MSISIPTLLSFTLLLPLAVEDDVPPTDLPLVFSEDFENGADRWEVTDPAAWTHREVDGNHVFGLNKRKSDYQPTVRSPHNIALVKDLQPSEFVMTFRVRSTKDTGNHRDCCIFFCHQDPTHFYYCHTGARPDPHSGQIMIVNNAPRLALTKNANPTPWKNETWHKVMISRRAKDGLVRVYFDDWKTPYMEVADTTFGAGRIGLGSFDDMNDFDDVRIYGR